MQQLTKDIALRIHKEIVYALEVLNNLHSNVEIHQQALPIPHWVPIEDTLEQLKKLYAASYVYVDEVLASIKVPEQDNYENVIRDITDAVKATLAEADRTNKPGELTFKIIIAPKGVSESIH